MTGLSLPQAFYTTTTSLSVLALGIAPSHTLLRITVFLNPAHPSPFLFKILILFHILQYIFSVDDNNKLEKDNTVE